MAEGKHLVCSHCTRTIEAWSDGNPYYLDTAGRKRYAYHPDHENLSRCIGNDVPHICVSCGAEQKVDSREPHENCLKCGQQRLVEIWNLEGHTCPSCRVGTFIQDPNWFTIS